MLIVNYKDIMEIFYRVKGLFEGIRWLCCKLIIVVNI